MAAIYLIEGPVGAGKSTFSGQLFLLHKAPHLNLDEWMVTLFSPDSSTENFPGWHSDRKLRCIQVIRGVACELLNSGTGVILKLGLVQAASRQDFYHRVDATDYGIQVYFINAPLALSRQRVLRRNIQKFQYIQDEGV